MLIHAKEYVEEHGGDTSDRFFAGQDANSGSSVMSTMNMGVHGSAPASACARATRSRSRHTRAEGGRGPLRRGAEHPAVLEEDIRAELIETDAIETVIGLARRAAYVDGRDRSAECRGSVRVLSPEAARAEGTEGPRSRRPPAPPGGTPAAP
ncbi:N-6 DNA methylase [Streptomyces maoxianensis]|uniref:N-6 DNA methylase n=1 Tax=Streptomyces maoxianensis TaxID=1459942 RepID=A0ABV9GAB1_9ACTN